MLSDANLSIIIQGIFDNSKPPTIHGLPITGKNITEACIQSMRRSFPNAEIILSTWSGTIYDGHNCDLIIFNKDPGAELCCDNPRLYLNLNRQIVSTSSGLQRATRKYALKVRSDLWFEDSRCLELIGKYKFRDEGLRYTSQRIIVTSVTTYNPWGVYSCPHHPCDWFYLGLLTDLQALFDIPLTKEPGFSRFYETNPKPPSYMDKERLNRFDPESYIWKSFLEKQSTISFDHMFDARQDTKTYSDAVFANNIVIYSPAQLGFRSLKYRWRIHYHGGCYTHADWLKLYKGVDALAPMPSLTSMIEKLQTQAAVYSFSIIPNYDWLSPYIDDPLNIASLAKSMLYLLAAIAANGFLVGYKITCRLSKSVKSEWN